MPVTQYQTFTDIRQPSRPTPMSIPTTAEALTIAKAG